jgi:hypothetical protein
MVDSDARQSSSPRDYAHVAEAGSRLPRSVNLHLLAGCNYRCGFCYQTEQGFRASLGTSDHHPLDRSGWLLAQKLLAAAHAARITYAGGEPTLVPYLDDLVLDWHRLKGGSRPAAMIVTNGTALYETRVRQIRHALAAVKLSGESNSSRLEASPGPPAFAPSARSSLHRSSLRLSSALGPSRGLRRRAVSAPLRKEDVPWPARHRAPRRR